MISPSKNLVANLVVEFGEYDSSGDDEPIRTDKFQSRYNTGGFRFVNVYSCANGKLQGIRFVVALEVGLLRYQRESFYLLLGF